MARSPKPSSSPQSASESRPSVAARILAFNEGRDPERLRFKYEAMRRDPFTFLRGTAHLFYEDLGASPAAGALQEAPLGWICGDLHLENFGTFRGANGLVYFDVNDFDEATLAPATWDVVRLLTSLYVATERLGARDSDNRILARAFLDAYCDALRAGKPFWLERPTARGAIRKLLRRVKRRPGDALIAARTQDERGRRFVIDGCHLLHASSYERARVRRLVRRLGERSADLEADVILDVARRVSGTGSLGVQRYAILVTSKHTDRATLLDLKEARPSVAEACQAADAPAGRPWESEAHRVVGVQYAAQAAAPRLLEPVVTRGRSYIMRELQPLEDRLSIDALAAHPKRLRHTIAMMGDLVAWLHLRTASRWGAAPVDDWAAWGRRPRWREVALHYVERYAAQVVSDWTAYSEAYDAGHVVVR